MTELESVTYPPLPALRHELTVSDLLAQAEKIKEAMTRGMDEGIHYGRIPGTSKPTLLKPGAEKLCVLFRLDPQYDSTEWRDGDHLTVKAKCTLWHIPTSQRLGSGEGSCSTRESKYAYRKKGGERIPNPDLPDQWNTVLKMGDKRSLIAAVLNVTAASDVFTQDFEDQEHEVVVVAPPKSKPAAHSETEPDSEREEVRREAAPFEEWILAFTKPTTEAALQALWRGVTEPSLWSSWSSNEQVQLTTAKNRAKARLGLKNG